MIFNPQRLLDMLHEAPERAGVSIKQVAQSMGKEPKTLARELNPDDDGAKLGVVDFAFLCAETRDCEALDYIETALGRVAFSLPPATAGASELHRTLGQAAREFGEVSEQLMTDLADGRLDEPEKALKEIADLASVLATLRALVVKTAHNNGRPDHA